ncbi:MAG TPA: DNA-processing protein DprA [Dehalococcoidia bacterium]|nr:DNA-processing protein DprA [Dehalococcoidia bacterium]
MDDLQFWAALSRVPQLGTVRFRRLESYFGTLDRAWQASRSELKAAGLEDRVADAVLEAQRTLSPAGEMERLEHAGVQVVNWHHSGYPPRLKETADPPPVLYVKGQVLAEDERSVAVVGTRNPTAYGREAAAALTADLARRGITIISGLALGIDGVAHRAALENGGRTIAVVANGLDITYPKEHARLSQQVEQRGAVVSEHPLGVRPDARSFPRRNRLISGMSLGTLVVEAGEGSGTFWTVRHALDQNREVFCVPGSIFSPASVGTNRLIQEGAKLVSTYIDVLEELNLSSVTRQIPMPLPQEVAGGSGDAAGAVLGQLDQEPLHIDDIRRRANLPITTVSSLLTLLEIQGKVKQVGCMHYIRVREATAAYGD